MKNLLILLLSLFLFGYTQSSNEALVFNRAYEIDACSIGDIGYVQLNEGQMHNQLVNLMIGNWSICSVDVNDLADEIKRILNSKGQSIVEENNMDYIEFKSLVSTTDLASLISTFRTGSFDFKQQISNLNFSAALSSKLKGFVDLMESMGSDQEVKSIQNSICEYYQQNKAGLSGDELVYFGIMTDVALFSTKLWLSGNLGGLNKYVEVQNKQNTLCGRPIPKKICWSCIILADAVGAVGAAATSIVASGGASAVPNPLFGGVPTAGVIAVIGGAVASINKAI